MTTTRISAADTHDLRRRILRAADPDAAVEWVGDDEDGTFHLGIRDESGAVVAISTWLHRPDPADPAAQATQLRGMATDPALAGRGLGSQLLLAGVERVARVATRPSGPNPASPLSVSTNGPVSPSSGPCSRPPTPGSRTGWCRGASVDAAVRSRRRRISVRPVAGAAPRV